MAKREAPHEKENRLINEEAEAFIKMAKTAAWALAYGCWLDARPWEGNFDVEEFEEVEDTDIPTDQAAEAAKLELEKQYGSIREE